MKHRFDLAASVIFILGALMAWLFGFPGGAAGLGVIFLGAIIAPGYLFIRLFRVDLSDALEIYPLSFAAGVSLFCFWGMSLFFIRGEVDAAIPGMLIIGAALAAMNRRVIPGRKDKQPFGGPGGLGWAALGTVIIIALFAFLLGGFRGWGENWDYYTYIAMVRRLAERGIAANYPVEYAGGGADPVHSYNVWALMWAALCRGARMDPIEVYIKSAFLTVPAALLAFYTLCKALFSRPTALAAMLVYGAYNLLGLGLILLGRTTFYNADPGWLIFFPAAAALALRYVANGGRGAAIAAIVVSCGAFMIHPLWGALLLPALGLLPLLSFFRGGGSAHRGTTIAALAGLAIFIAPLAAALAASMAGVRIKIPAWLELWGGMGLFIGLPMFMALPWLVVRARALWNDPVFRRSWIMMGLAIASLAPFAITRFMDVHGARPEIFTATHPYKLFITDRLFVLSYLNYTYTAPGMTFYPLSALGVLALPWLVLKGRKLSPWAGLAAAGVVLVPLIATHPYLSFIFVKVAHTAYLRRALRVSGMFAACGAGALVGAAALKRPRWAGLTASFLALAIGGLCALYPYSPAYFRGALAKSWFIITKAPARGLFWHPLYNAYKIKGVTWDREKFANLVKDVPAGETVFSDRFTSYRLPAHRDIYVVCRMKPSAGATDQAHRQKDQARFFRPETSQEERCRILKKYASRWALLNVDPDYRLRDYYLGDPWTARKLDGDAGRFRRSGRVGPWALFEALDTCLR